MLKMKKIIPWLFKEGISTKNYEVLKSNVKDLEIECVKKFENICEMKYDIDLLILALVNCDNENKLLVSKNTEMLLCLFENVTEKNAFKNKSDLMESNLQKNSDHLKNLKRCFAKKRTQFEAKIAKLNKKNQIMVKKLGHQQIRLEKLTETTSIPKSTECQTDEMKNQPSNDMLNNENILTENSRLLIFFYI